MVAPFYTLHTIFMYFNVSREISHVIVFSFWVCSHSCIIDWWWCQSRVETSCCLTNFFASCVLIVTENFYRYYKRNVLLYLYRARNKITQLSITTHAQLQHHRLKFIKNHLKNSYMFRSSTILRDLQCPRKNHYYYWPQLDVFMLRVVMWQHVVLFVLGYTWRVPERTCFS